MAEQKDIQPQDESLVPDEGTHREAADSDQDALGLEFPDPAVSAVESPEIPAASEADPTEGGETDPANIIAETAESAEAPPTPKKAKILQLQPRDGKTSGIIPVKAKVMALTPKKTAGNEGDEHPVATVKVKPAVPLQRGERSDRPVQTTPVPEAEVSKPDAAAAPTPIPVPVAPAPSSSGNARSTQSKPPVPPLKRPVHVVGTLNPDTATVGQILQDARVRLDFSIHQIEQVTKIKKSFIESLERDDFHGLPQPVYVNAYVRTLCDLYGIEPQLTAELLEKLRERNRSRTVSEEILQHIEEDKQINPEEELRIRRILIVTAAVIVILLMTIGILIAVYVVPGKSSNRVESVKSMPTAESLLPKQYGKDLVRPQFLNMTELEVPGSRQP